MFKASFVLTCITILLAAAVHAQAPDLTTPDVQKLKTEAVAQRAEIVRQRSDALRKLIGDQLENVRQGLSKAKISGNITATASGNAAVKIFTDVMASFDKDGTYAIAGKIRADLEATLDEFKRNAQAIEDKQTAGLQKLNKTFAVRLGEVLTRQKNPVTDEAKLLDLWTPLLNAAAAASASTNAVATAGGAPGGTNTVAAAALPAASTMLQSQGDTANWTPLVKLEATVHDALEVVSVPLAGITAPKSFDGVGGMGNPWQVKATPYQELAPGNAAPAFRIQSAPPFKPMEVAAWPSARNNWTLELRAKADRIPSRHAIVVETDAAACKQIPGGAPPPAAAAGPATSAHGSGAPAPTIKVRFESQPDGAVVLLNNQPLLEQNKPLTTPFDYALSTNPVDIVFRKRGYKDAVLRQVFPTSNKPFHVTLEEAPGFADVTIPVSATATTDWTPTGVSVKKGNQVRIAASGTWSCGSGGEMVDADGYPNNDAYFKYYVDPLQNPHIFPKANYGQLIARVLPNGEIASVGKQGAFLASTDGEVALAINEPPNARMDNRGKVSARIMVDR